MMLLTFSLIIGISGTVFYWSSFYVAWYVVVAACLLLIFNVTSLCLTACNNPGVLKRRTEQTEDMQRWRYHSMAQAYQPPGSKYCDECQVFVHGYDHFCPWTGTAIAGNNLPFFYGFVGSLNFLCVAVFVLVFLSLSSAAYHHRKTHGHP